MIEVGVVDHGLGNILSVLRALEHIGASPRIVTTPQDIKSSQRIVIPGNGSFPEGMKNLHKLGLSDILRREANDGKPFLGICLGMQMLFDSSHEVRKTSGLGVLRGEVVQIDNGPSHNDRLRLLSMGWRRVNSKNMAQAAVSLNNALNDRYFYFVHSFEVRPKDTCIVSGFYEWKGLEIVAAIRSNNIFGYQFHPEKSGVDGLKLIEDFMSCK